MSTSQSKPVLPTYGRHGEDQQFEETTVKSARKDGPGWLIERADGWSFYVPPESPVEPKAGDKVRFYGKGMGYPVRGLLINGEVVFYRTDEEHRAHAERESYGADAAELLARWDAGRSVWSVAMGGFGPGYEQALQITVFEVLRALIDGGVDPDSLTDTTIWKAERDRLHGAITPIVEPLGLSGAQWGAAVGLAFAFYRLGPIEVHKTTSDDRHIQVSRDFPSIRPSTAT